MTRRARRTERAVWLVKIPALRRRKRLREVHEAQIEDRHHGWAARQPGGDEGHAVQQINLVPRGQPGPGQLLPGDAGQPVFGWPAAA